MRQTRDRDSVEMLQIASEAAVYDLAEIYGWGGVYTAIVNSIINGKPFVSQVKTLSKLTLKAAERAIEKLTADD